MTTLKALEAKLEKQEAALKETRKAIRALKSEGSVKLRERTSTLPTNPVDLKTITLDNLSASHLKAIKEDPSAKKYVDMTVGDGLVLRLSPTGKITFRYTYQLEGKSRALTIGQYPTRSLASLRREYNIKRDEVDDGIDPAKKSREVKTEKREQKAKQEAKAKVKTVSELTELFIDYIENPAHVSSRDRPWSHHTIQSYRNCLNNHFVPEFGSVRIDAIDDRRVSGWLAEVAETRGILSNRILGAANVMFKWSIDMDRDYLQANPLVRIKMKAVEKSKTRALDYDETLGRVQDTGEIREFWETCDTMNPLIAGALRLILLTGQRPGEVCAAKWEHIPEGDDLWILPASHTKNHTIHQIPLDATVKRHLKAIRAISGHTAYLFPRTRLADGKLHFHKTNRAMDTTILSDAVHRTFTGMKAWSPHDLRRTLATHTKALGVNEFEIGQILNHTFTGVTKDYARGTDVAGIGKNLSKWHRKLNSILKVDQANNIIKIA